MTAVSERNKGKTIAIENRRNLDRSSSQFDEQIHDQNDGVGRLTGIF